MTDKKQIHYQSLSDITACGCAIEFMGDCGLDPKFVSKDIREVTCPECKESLGYGGTGMISYTDEGDHYNIRVIKDPIIDRCSITVFDEDGVAIQCEQIVDIAPPAKEMTLTEICSALGFKVKVVQ